MSDSHSSKFWARVAELGARPAPGSTYRNSRTPVALICAVGHLCTPRPANVQRGRGPCRICANHDSKAAESAFWARVRELRARPAPDSKYRDSRTPVALICAAGHACHPRPTSLQQGQGPCRVCARNDAAAAEVAFWAAVEECRALPAPHAVYKNSQTPVALTCAVSHHCAPRPANLLRGQGPCRTCAGNDPEAAEAAFWAAVDKCRALPAHGAVYKNTETPVALICAVGHHCAPRPADLRRGQGPCRTCAGNDPEAAEAAFWAAVERCRALPAAAAVYENKETPVALICAAGHHCAPRPAELRRGQGPCRTCAGNDPKAAEAAFWAAVDNRGARPAANAKYEGSHTPVSLICAAGHACNPRPNSLQQGQGICQECLVAFDRVYLLHHPETGAVKIGVASGNARVRQLCDQGYVLVSHWLGLEVTPVG